ncbi:peptidylprolyl isomerase [Gilvimarinus japonicus]|uniref:peptidylprolyl isomerase n=1 Tax=Gilvimarinus japonicus TaxID=1796469 RepID=UPI0036F3F64D
MFTLLSLSVGVSAWVCAEESPRDQVLLTAETVAITAADLEHYVQERLHNGLTLERFAEPGAIPRLLENLMMIRLLADRADSEGVNWSKQQQWELDLQRDRLMYDALVASRVADVVGRTDWQALAKETYVAESDRFQAPERVDASHILIRINKDRDEAEAKALAEVVEAKLAAGESFAALAREYSEDGSSESGGHLGVFNREKMVPEFSQAAFALRVPGEVSGLVRTNFGYHLIKLNKHIPAGKKPFDEVREQLVAKLQASVEVDVRKQLTLDARSPSNYKLNEDLLRQVESKYVDDASK